jgi:predicted enzyme related to lactoylglutathione lyase
MAGPHLTHVLIFTTDLDRVAAFYAGAFGYRREDTADEGVVMMRGAGGADLALHQVPPDIAAEIALTSPPRWRDDTALKLCFAVDDLGGARAAVLAHGGQAKEPWSWAGTDFCECADVKGNSLQLVHRPGAG